MDPIGLLVLLLVICIVIWAARSLMAAFGVGEPLNTVVYVALVLICLFYLLQRLGLRLPG